MKREAATFCLGLWLMGTVCVSVAAMQDFYTIDRLLADPGNDTFAGMVESIGRAESRDFLRFLSSELNRLFFQLWNWSQFVIGGATLWLVLGVPGHPGSSGRSFHSRRPHVLGHASDPVGRPQPRLRASRSGPAQHARVRNPAHDLHHAGNAQARRGSSCRLLGRTHASDLNPTSLAVWQKDDNEEGGR